MDDILRAALINAAVASSRAIIAGYKAENRRRADRGSSIHYDVEFNDEARLLDERVAQIMAMDPKTEEWRPHPDCPADCAGRVFTGSACAACGFMPPDPAFPMAAPAAPSSCPDEEPF